MFRILLRVLGVLLCGLTLVVALLAAMFRMDTSDELEWILRADGIIGLLLVMSVVLARYPEPGAASFRKYGFTALLALLCGSAVAATLVGLHLTQYKVRFTQPSRFPAVQLDTSNTD